MLSVWSHTLETSSLSLEAKLSLSQARASMSFSITFRITNWTRKESWLLRRSTRAYHFQEWTLQLFACAMVSFWLLVAWLQETQCQNRVNLSEARAFLKWNSLAWPTQCVTVEITSTCSAAKAKRKPSSTRWSASKWTRTVRFQLMRSGRQLAKCWNQLQTWASLFWAMALFWSLAVNPSMALLRMFTTLESNTLLIKLSRFFS